MCSQALLSTLDLAQASDTGNNQIQKSLVAASLDYQSASNNLKIVIQKRFYWVCLRKTLHHLFSLAHHRRLGTREGRSIRAFQPHQLILVHHISIFSRYLDRHLMDPKDNKFKVLSAFAPQTSSNNITTSRTKNQACRTQNSLVL